MPFLTIFLPKQFVTFETGRVPRVWRQRQNYGGSTLTSARFGLIYFPEQNEQSNAV
jgi:hypothetical protein